jgi:nucleotide sugar dehydrogenase
MSEVTENGQGASASADDGGDDYEYDYDERSDRPAIDPRPFIDGSPFVESPPLGVPPVRPAGAGGPGPGSAGPGAADSRPTMQVPPAPVPALGSGAPPPTTEPVRDAPPPPAPYVGNHFDNRGAHAMSDQLADELIARIESRSARILVVGQGYVGLPVAMRAVEVGFPVAGLESSRDRVEALRSARSYVSDVTDDELQSALGRGYLPSDDPSETGAFDIAVITVPTPLREGAPDLSHVEAAAEVLARRLRTGTLVILESTTYPGTTDELVRPILERASGLKAGTEFFVGYSPERIDPGNPNYGFVNTPKVVSGVDERSGRCVEAFYGALVDKVVPVASTAEAELVKLLENTFRHVNIALVNELAMFAADLDIDIWGAIDAASSKPFGYMRFTPGPGVGGHCLPIDPSYLSWRVRRRLGQTFRFVELANDVNEHMPDYVVTRVVTLLNRESRAVRGSRILVLGLSYKAGTSDWRESPSIAVVERLLGLGADVRACEPYLPEQGGPNLPAVQIVDCTRDELQSADLVLLLVDHPDFPLDEIAEASRLVFDAKGVLRNHRFEGETI